jgi:hypothetical protein
MRSHSPEGSAPLIRRPRRKAIRGEAKWIVPGVLKVLIPGGCRGMAAQKSTQPVGRDVVEALTTLGDMGDNGVSVTYELEEANGGRSCYGQVMGHTGPIHHKR